MGFNAGRAGLNPIDVREKRMHELGHTSWVPDRTVRYLIEAELAKASVARERIPSRDSRNIRDRQLDFQFFERGAVDREAAERSESARGR